MIPIRIPKTIDERKPSIGNLYNSPSGKLSRVDKWFTTKEKIVNPINFLNQFHPELLITESHSVLKIFFFYSIVFIHLKLISLSDSKVKPD